MRYLTLAILILALALTGCAEPDCVRLRLERTDTPGSSAAVIWCGSPSNANYPDGVRIEIDVEAIGSVDDLKGGAL